MAKVTLSVAAQNRIERVKAIRELYMSQDFTSTNFHYLNGETRKLARMGRTDRWSDAVAASRKLINAKLISGPEASGNNWQSVIAEVTDMLVKAAI